MMGVGGGGVRFIVRFLVWEWVLEGMDGPLPDTNVFPDTNFDTLVCEGTGERG